MWIFVGEYHKYYDTDTHLSETDVPTPTPRSQLHTQKGKIFKMGLSYEFYIYVYPTQWCYAQLVTIAWPHQTNIAPSKPN